MLSTSKQLLKKSEAAIIAAVEVYNKPTFAYREETFAMLALNAWELLLKAKLVADANNDVRILWVREPRRLKSGSLSTRLYVRRNRSGNPYTINLGQAIAELAKSVADLPPPVRSNLQALTEIRDNAVHFMNASPLLAKTVLEIGSATLKNFVELGRVWFELDLSSYPLFLMPIGFIAAPGSASAVAAGSDEERLIEYLTSLMRNAPTDAAKGFHVALEVDLSFKRASGLSATPVSWTSDPSAPKVLMAEEDIRKIFRWEYSELVERCRARYSNFKRNSRCHDLMKRIKADPKLCKVRLLDLEKPQGVKKEYYNPNALQVFDQHYTRK